MAQNGTGPNKLAIILSAVLIVAVAAVTVLVVWMNNRAAAPTEAPAATSVNQDTGAITIGDGPGVISEYVDFMCPFCGQYWDTYGKTVRDGIRNGTTTLELHPISILDARSQGTQFSSRAAASVYCVADANSDAVYPYVDVLFSKQPQESSPGLDNDELVRYAEQVGAGEAASCINDGTYMDFVAEQAEKMPVAPGAAGPSTPTIVMNGAVVQLNTFTGDPEVDLAPVLGNQ